MMLVSHCMLHLLYLFNDLLTTTTIISNLVSFWRMWIALKRTVCGKGFRVGSSTFPLGHRHPILCHIFTENLILSGTFELLFVR